MITQKQSDGLVSFIDGKIAEIREQIETAEEVHAEAPNRSEYFDMKFDDEMTELEWKLEKYEQLRHEAEMLEVEEEREFPPKHLYLPVERRAA